MRISVITRSIHPHLGGEKVTIRLFEMSEGVKAEEYYNKQAQYDESGYQSTEILICIEDREEKAESEVARLRGIIGRLECWNYPEICKVKKCQTCRAKDEANKGREGGR